MTVLDSSVWIAYLNANDSQHAKAKRAFAKAGLPLILPEYVILEVCTVLAKRAGKDVANRFLEIVGNNKDIRLLLTDEDFLSRLSSEYGQLEGNALSFVDASLLLLSSEFPVVTFDEALHKEIRKRAGLGSR